MKYSEYFDINPTYYPMIDPDSVKDPEIKWQLTYPHQTFIELLEITERMLARESSSAKRGIWIEGSYGTGKSRVVWTLQNLLECKKEELCEYFDSFESLRKKPDLKGKLLAQKEGIIVTVSRYGSGEITSIRQFIMAVYESVTKVLRHKNLDYKGYRTLRGKIASWLEEETHSKIFELLITKPEYRSLGSFNGKTAKDIVALLNAPNSNVDFLLNDIFELAEKEGITMFDISMDDLKLWLTDVIIENKIKAIVFFWDEFSAFFKNNKTSLDIFQKLAELSADKPFYFVIVTHMSGSLVGPTDQAAFQLVKDRFIHKTIEMPDNIAFELIHDAMKIKSVAREEYNDLTDELNSYMSTSRNEVCKYAKIDESVMKGIFPIHPMAALLLKNISRSFASNQRSMFNFIKNTDSDNLQAFQWFINNHSPEDGQILTIDYLWNFFYEKGRDENTTGVGRSNLDVAIATILDTYPLNESKLGSIDEKRVLKTVLMMQAISRKLNNSVELLRPNDKNISWAFEGDDTMENNRAINIIQNCLVANKILYVDSSSGINEYAAAAVAGDQVQIDAIKDRIRKETKTLSLITTGELANAFSFDDALKQRYEFSNVSIDTFTLTINKICNQNKSYKLQSVICYARSEDEHSKMITLINNAVSKDIYKEIIFIDNSANIMGSDRYERYIDLAAQEEYWRKKDPKLADDKLDNKKLILGEWRDLISKGNFVVYKAAEPKMSCSGIPLLNNTLYSIILKIYPLSFDNAKVSGNLFIGDKFTAGAKYGVKETFGGVYQEKSIKAILGDVINKPNYWEEKKNLSISKLKLEVKGLIDNKFKSEVRISIGEIFDTLMTLGFMPCNLYAYLAGFLLKEYSQQPYRYGIGSSGDDGGVMTPDKLGEIIGEYIKHKIQPIKNYKEKFIEIMTPNQKAFVDFVCKAFSVPNNLSVEQTASRMRVKLKEIGYPVWCFKAIDNNNLSAFIDKISAIANTQEGDNVPNLASDLGKMLLQIPNTDNKLTELFTPENGLRAMNEFLQSYKNGELLSLAKSIGVDDVMSDVKRQISSGEASWLWDKETGLEELDKLIVDYKIIDKSNKFDNVTKATNFYTCLKAWSECTYFLKIPYFVCKEKMQDLAVFFDCLKSMLQDGDLTNDKRIKFLNEIDTKFSNIKDLNERKMRVFRDTYSIYLQGLSDKEVNKVYSLLSNTSFTSDQSTFEEELRTITETIKKEKKRFQLIDKWKTLTGTDSPNDWSEKFETPIKLMVTSNELQNAIKLFNTINSANAEEKDVNFSLDYLNGNPAFISTLKDSNKIEMAFTENIIGRYAIVLKDNSEVREYLKEHVPDNCYNWSDNRAVRELVTKLAKQKYLSGDNKAVMEEITRMTPEKAKDVLKRLAKEDIEVGISYILQKEE